MRVEGIAPSAPQVKVPRLYILKVALYGRRGTWRRIAIRGDQTLGALHRAIFHAFDRYDEHLYTFYLGPKSVTLTPHTAHQQAVKYSHPQAIAHDGFWDVAGFEKRTPPREKNAEETSFEALRLGVGRQLLYLFDFGDDWWHLLTVENTNAEPDPSVTYPAVIATRGASPAQYPEYDGEDE